MTHSFWQQQDQGPTLSCDTAVIGGGIIGTSTAYWIKKLDPDADVVLLESRTVGHGASGRNAGFILQGTASNYAADIQTYGEDTAQALWKFTAENRRLIEEHFSSKKIRLNPSGSLIASGSAEEQEALIRSAELLTRDGVEVSLWNRSRLESELSTDKFYGALAIPTGASMNPLKLLREIGGMSGARILEHHPVSSLHYEGKQCIIDTSRRRIHANRVFLALNAYLPQLLPSMESYVRPIRAQMFASAPQPPWLPYPVYSHEGYYYIRQAPDGSILAGGARHLFKEEEVGYDDQTTAQLQHALETYYKTHFPGRPALTINKRWSGTMGFTSDGLPLFSEAEGFPGSYWASGFNGHGMGYGFRFGKLMASLFTESTEEALYRNLFHKSRIEQ